MTVISNELQIKDIKFEDLSLLIPYSYLPPRGSVSLERPREVTTGSNINGQRYYIFGQRAVVKVLNIKPPEQYAIPGSMAQLLMNLWNLENILAATFTVTENYTTFDGSTKVWNKCIMLKEPVFTQLDGEELRYFYSYDISIGLLEE